MSIYARPTAEFPLKDSFYALIICVYGIQVGILLRQKNLPQMERCTMSMLVNNQVTRVQVHLDGISYGLF